MSTPTPTPEAIEAAARALGSSPNRADWSLKLRDAEDALSAAYPLMEAQAKGEALREAMSDEALEAARLLIESELIEWRDSSMFALRNNGLSIRNKDGSGSEIIRFGFEMGYHMALNDRLKTIEGASK